MSLHVRRANSGSSRLSNRLARPRTRGRRTVKLLIRPKWTRGEPMIKGVPRRPAPIQVREYGRSGSPVVLVHGGPGVPGSMAAIARRLADSFRVLEPLQRGGGSGPLTVARHVADLHETIETLRGDARPALVGHSW